MAEKESSRTWGERVASRYLESMGYEVLKQHLTCKNGRADVIARQDDEIALIRVVVRRDPGAGFAEIAPTAELRRSLETAAVRFLKDYDAADFIIRFDTISIIKLDEVRSLIKHHVNALGPA